MLTEEAQQATYGAEGVAPEATIYETHHADAAECGDSLPCGPLQCLRPYGGQYPRQWSGTLGGYRHTLLLRGFIHTRSNLLYGFSGTISNRSAPIASARLFASFLVTPLAEKYAIKVFIHFSPLIMDYYIIKQ